MAIFHKLCASVFEIVKKKTEENNMETISRTIRHDEVLGLEAFCLQGYAQPFPRHFHDYYVFGLMVSGERELLAMG